MRGEAQSADLCGSGLCGSGRGRKSQALVKGPAVLEAVVELADHAVEEVALGGCVPVPMVIAAPPVVGHGAG